MMKWLRPAATMCLGLTVLLAACAAPAPSDRSAGGADGPKVAALKRVTAVVDTEHPTLISKFEKALPGAEAVEAAVAAGFSVMGDQGSLTPVLAEQVPTVDNGLWKVFPDGRMETTWKIRKDAKWHDGTAFTAEDVLFTATVGRHPDLPNFRHPGYELSESVEAPDQHTVKVLWKQPYIAADTVFNSDLNGTRVLFPLPRHILELPYIADPVGFTDLSYWSEDYVGTGPFRLKDWERGSHIILVANDDFVLGRPKVDEFVIRFVADMNTAVATILAGEADMTLGRGLSFQQAVEAGNRWTEGKMENVSYKSRFTLYPQFIDPDPRVILDVRFRQALMHALDRQTMADTLQLGMAPPAHSYIGPDNPMYKATESRIVKYEHDPQKATQIVESLGYARGQDGIFRDAAGKRLSVEIRSTPGEIYDLILQAVAQYWQQAGVGTETLAIPRQRQRDRQWRATRPGFEMTRRGTNLSNLESFHSRQTELPETNFLGSNVPRYRNPEFDALIERYFVTVPLPERTQVTGDIMHHISSQLNMMELFYDGEPALIANRLVNVKGRSSESTQTWNIHLWDLK